MRPTLMIRNMRSTQNINICCGPVEPVPLTPRKNQTVEGIDTTRLESYKLEISNTYNTFVILYPDAEESFTKQYETSKDTFIAFIDMLVRRQSLLEVQYNVHETERMKAENTRYATDTKNLENKAQKLWEAAQATTSKLIVK